MANRQLYTIRYLATAALVLLAIARPAGAEAEDWIDSIDNRGGVERYRQQSQAVRGFLIPLGPIEKVRGSWQFKQHSAFSGTLKRTTWQVSNAPVIDVFSEVLDELKTAGEVAFACDGRRCGNASQWASRLYQERLLYGRAEYLRYAAVRLDDGGWLTLFSAARTADRQYLHLDVAIPE